MREPLASAVAFLGGFDRYIAPESPALGYAFRIALAADQMLHYAGELVCAVTNGPRCDHCGESALSGAAARFMGWRWRGPDCQGAGWWCRGCQDYIVAEKAR